MVNLLGWCGNTFFVVGIYTLAKKSVAGFYINIAANLIYAWQSILLGNSPLFWLSFILVGLNCMGIIKWSERSYLILRREHV